VVAVDRPGLRGLGWRYAGGTGRHHPSDRPDLADGRVEATWLDTLSPSMSGPAQQLFTRQPRIVCGVLAVLSLQVTSGGSSSESAPVGL